MIKLLLLSVLLLPLHDSKIQAQTQKGKWVQSDITIDWRAAYNGTLYNDASVKAFICNEAGSYEQLGRFLKIENQGNETVFYRAAPSGLGKYITQKDKEFIATVSNMSQYYPVNAGQSDIIEIHGYETAHEKTLNMKLIVEFKFFQPNPANKKTVNNTPPATQVPPSNPTITKSKPDNSFYIFLSAPLTIKHRPATIISAPILHTGKVTDDMTGYMKDFIDQIEKLPLDKPTNFKELLSRNNYEAMYVHFGKPYETDLLKTVDETVIAIAAYKKSLLDAIAGLGEMDFYDSK